MPALRYQRACLLFESGAAAEAGAAFTDLVRDFPGEDSASEARILSVAASLCAGRHAEALATLAMVEESRQGIPAMAGAELLPARVHAAAGNLTEALVRARKVAATGRTERDRALAGLLAAEVQLRQNDGAGMLASIRGLPSGFERKFRDLVPLVELATGIALRILHDERAAVVHLRVALRTVEPPLKASVACAIGECFLSLAEPVPAWIAIRQAESLEKDQAELRRIRTRRAEIEASFGALGRATETCLALLQDATGPFPEAERVLATLARCLIAGERVAEARVTLEALSDRETWRGWALIRLAQLERKAGEPEKALRALSRITASDLKEPGPSAAEVRRLRGDLLLDLGDPLQAAEVFRGAQEGAR
jgi:tetratricopeptide (TPR) repeat protein